jgi:pimeloyl-ACP methyl ester carboxylesterase
MVLVLALVAAWAASGVVVARVLTRRARPVFEEPAPPGHVALRLRTSDGLSLGAWYRERVDERAAVVLVHGNGGSRTLVRAHAARLHELGCSVLSVSLRAHGDSEGDVNDLGYSARFDVLAATAHLRAHAPARRVVVVGLSLGAAAALYASPELDVDGYVLAAPYADLRLATRRRTRRYLPHGLDVLAYEALVLGARVWLPDLDRLRPAAHARIRSHVPVVIVVGERDDRAPRSDADAIAASVPQAWIELVANADHEATLAHLTSAQGVAAIERVLGPR